MDAVQGRLDIEGVETGLHEDQVHPAFDEGAGLRFIGCRYLVETAGAPFRTEEVGHQGQGLGSGPHTAGHPHLARSGVGHFTRQPGGGESHSGRQGGQTVIPLDNGVGPETVGLDNVGPRIHVSLVDGPDHIRARQVQAFVVAQDVTGRSGTDTLPEIGLRKAVTLDLGTHRPVQP